MKRLTFLGLIEHLSALVTSRISSTRRLLVAIDGPDCSGKTSLGRSLNGHVMANHSSVLIHFDDYLNSRRVREKRGEFSCEAFLYDYFNEDALVKSVLRPLSRRKLFDTTHPQVVIVEGLFLLRPRLASYFDLRVRLEIEEPLLLKRALARDTGVLGTRSWVERHYREQCIPAQRKYRDTVISVASVDILIWVQGDDAYDISSENTARNDSRAS